MKKQFLLIPVLAIFFMIHGSVQAQEYKSAIGARLGYPLSVSFKTNLNEKNALEAYVGYRGFSGFNWLSASGAYLIHDDLGDTEGLRWYYGGGAGVIFWSYDDDFFFEDTESSLGFTLNGYIGLEYTFSDVPINLTLDWVPTFIISGFGSATGFGADYGSLGVRYVLSR